MRRREIFLELTSLLDVILILLFVLLTQARTQTTEALAASEADRAEAQALRDRLTETRQELDGARERSEQLQRQILTDKLVLDESLVVTLSAEGFRSIRVESRDSAQSIPYDWGDEAYASNALRSELLGLLRRTERGAVFIVFQFDRAAIYRTEYDMIGRVVNEVKLEAKQRDIPLSYIELDISQGVS